MVAYDENSEEFFKQLSDLISQNYPKIKLVGYHENKLKERKKAFGVKGGYGARITPFTVVLDHESKPLKAFYSEVNECTINNIQNYLDLLYQSLIKLNYESTSN
jgi:hypothetical protein